jgi:hypothetical protein
MAQGLHANQKHTETQDELKEGVRGHENFSGFKSAAAR